MHNLIPSAVSTPTAYTAKPLSIFFWSGDAEILSHLVEVAEANSDKKFGSSLATLAGALMLALQLDAKKHPKLEGKNLKASLETILGIREEHKTELDFEKFLGLDEEEEHDASDFNAAPLRNFRGTTTFTDFICGVELDESIKIKKESPELRRLRDATNEKIGDIAFANLCENHRRGMTSESVGTTTGGDTEATKDPETDSTLHPDFGSCGNPVARRKKRKMGEEPA